MPRTIFQATEFTPTRWDSAHDKAEFANWFADFVSSGFPFTKFHQKRYRRMSMCRGHIAHFNRDGFFGAQFETRATCEKFLQHWLASPIYGDPKHTFSDVERALSKWLGREGWEVWLERIAARKPAPFSEYAG